MSRRIFRPSALNRYNERLEKIELPRYASAPWILLMWLVGFLLLLATAFLLAVELPEHAEGPGLVVAGGSPGANQSGTAVIALLPVHLAPRLAPGQAAEVRFPGSPSGEEQTFMAAVRSVETDPLSPAAARRRFGVDLVAAGHINGPVTVALLDAEFPAEAWAGSVGTVQIEVGSRSMLSLLPGLVAGETGLGASE